MNVFAAKTASPTAPCSTPRGVCMLGGLLLNAVILLAPLVVAGRFDLPLRDPAAFAFFALATLFCAGDLTTLWRAAGGWERPADRSAHRHDMTARRLALATGLALLTVFWSGLIGRACGFLLLPFSPRLSSAGAVLMFAGTLLRWVSVRTLGRGFRTEFTPQTPLVCHGVYRLVRHPSETGLLAVALGAALLLDSGVALVVCLGVLLPLVCRRIDLEERRLLQAFGDEYRRYRRRAGRLLPLIY